MFIYGESISDKPSDDVVSTTSSTATTPSEGSELDKQVTTPVSYVIRRSLLGAPADITETVNVPPSEASQLSVTTANSW